MTVARIDNHAQRIGPMIRWRFQLGLRAMMVLVAVVALGMAGVHASQRRSEFKRRALLHTALSYGGSCGHGRKVPEEEARESSRYHAGLARKYQIAAERPWLSVSPDPPKP
jgi:hypothetical protein